MPLRGTIAGLAFLLSVSAAVAAPPIVSRVHDVLNKAATVAKISLRVEPSGCEAPDRGECTYSAPPGTRIQVSGESNKDRADELGAYLPPEKRSGADAAQLLLVMLKAFSPHLSPAETGRILNKLVDGATGAGQRGEEVVRGVTYVLRPNDGTDVRIYVKWR